MQNPPADFVDLKTLGLTPRFYLWTNDYTAADATEVERPNKFWHWNRGPKDYTKGFWKWESTLNHQGVCMLPEAAQIAEKIAEIRTILGL